MEQAKQEQRKTDFCSLVLLSQINFYIYIEAQLHYILDKSSN